MRHPVRRSAASWLLALCCVVGLGACTPLGGGRGAGSSTSTGAGSGGVTVFGDVDAAVTRTR
ncbi:hypothetical protein [uncultured Xylophilus sp.]|uniref:hypothetical protein n=1 Tax=uncultured Xylophilus sp. TaxID=296832 RepID=UPI0025DCA7D2|nr:hypothetical protein [uncultured Xylophilus sp.]